MWNQASSGVDLVSQQDVGALLILLGVNKRNISDDSTCYYIDGDVVVLSAGTNGKYEAGHVRIYYNSKWYPDIEQRSIYPWNNAHY